MRQGRKGGFTLVEVLIVVTVVAILAAVAIPAYRDQVRRANRSAAQQFMLDVATREEQVLQDSRNYVAVTATANFPNAPSAGSPGLNLLVPDRTTGNYTFVVVVSNAATPPTFTITGTAISAQAVDGNLTLDQAGLKTPTAKW